MRWFQPVRLGLQQFGLGIASTMSGIAKFASYILDPFASSSTLTTTGGDYLTVRQWDNTLVEAPIDTPAMEGGRLATTVADGADLGMELVNNTVGGWTTSNGTLTEVGGVFTLTATAAGLAYATQNIATVSGRRYQLSSISNSGPINLYMSGVFTGYWGDITSGATTEIVSPDTTSPLTTYFTATGAGETITWEGVSIKEVIPTWKDTDTSGLDLWPTTTVRDSQGTKKLPRFIPNRSNSTAYADGDEVTIVGSDGIPLYGEYTAGTSAASPPTVSIADLNTPVTDGTATLTIRGYNTLVGLSNWAGGSNLFLVPATPATQNITTTAQSYTVSVVGTGDITLSGTAAGTATEGSPLTVTATAGTLTCTVTGSLDYAQVETGTSATPIMLTSPRIATNHSDVALSTQTEIRIIPKKAGPYTIIHDGTNKLSYTGTNLEFTDGVTTLSAAATLTAGTAYTIGVDGTDGAWSLILDGTPIDTDATGTGVVWSAVTYGQDSTGGTNIMNGYIQKVVSDGTGVL